MSSGARGASSRNPRGNSTLGIIVLLFILFITIRLSISLVNLTQRNAIKSYIRKFSKDINTYMVKDFIELIRDTNIKNRPDIWNVIRAGFQLVTISEEIDYELKVELYKVILSRGINPGNFQIRKSQEEIKKETDDYGREGEKNIQYALKWLEEYQVLHNTIVPSHIDHQEIDHIVIGKNGVFHLETKTFSGNITIDANGDWFRVKNGISYKMDYSPVYQLLRHEKVLQDFIHKKLQDVSIPIVGIIVLANKETLLEGASNCSQKVLKIDRLVEYIENYHGDKSLDNEMVLAIHKALSEAR